MEYIQNINTKIDEIGDLFKTAISVDCVIFGYDENDLNLKVLTLECDMEPFKNKVSLVGDLVLPSESIDEAANRILWQRAGIENVFLKQIQAYGAPERHPRGRVVSVAYYALINTRDFAIKEESIHHPSWKNVLELNEEEMAFDHHTILEDCLKHVQENLLDVPVEYMLPRKFTLSQLQKLYETILGEQLDKRNFRKRILKQSIVTATNEIQKNVAHRPAKLFKINKSRKKVFSLH